MELILSDSKKTISIELVRMFAICSARRTVWHFAIAGIYSGEYGLYLH